MAELKDVVVPDIGDFTDVPIIEVMVGPGDTVAPEDPIVTPESDKATMDVPAPFGGVVKELKVRTGDTVSEGSLLLTLAVDGDQAGGGNGAAASHAGVTEEGAETEESQPSVRPPGPRGDGDGASAASAPAPSAPARAAAPPEAAAPAAPAEPAAPVQPAGPVYAGPGARRLAR